MSKREISIFLVSLLIPIGLAAQDPSPTVSEAAPSSDRLQRLENELQQLHAQIEQLEQQLRENTSKSPEQGQPPSKFLPDAVIPVAAVPVTAAEE